MTPQTEHPHVRDIMTLDPVTTTEDARVSEAYGLMTTKRIQHLPVLREGQVVGVLSERHVRDAMPFILTLKDPEARKKTLAVTRVSDVMIKNPAVIAPTATVLDAITHMRKLRSGSLPVVEGGKLVGIVTSGDLVNLLERMLLGRPVAAR